MQIHQLRPNVKHKKRKRVGRGGKRGTFSGRGSKGQKSRAGHRIRPGFRGGDNPVWKLFPKQRGATKKTDAKHAMFQPRENKPAILNLGDLNDNFTEGEKISGQNLVKKGLIRTAKDGVKILNGGELKKKLNFSGIEFSVSAKEKVIKLGGQISN